jgi:protein-tyrosine phosphatase-like protein/uncharacterized protein DUF3562
MNSQGMDDIHVRLRKEFAATLPAETVDRTLDDSVATLTKGARVQLFVPVLAERVARDRLRAMSREAAPLRRTG